MEKPEFEQWCKTIAAFSQLLRFENSSDIAKYKPCFRTTEGLKVYKKLGKEEKEIGAFVFHTFYSNDMDTSQGEFIFKINPHLNELLILMPHELKQLSEITSKLLKETV